MKSFRDNKGVEWVVNITVGALRRVRDLGGIDLGHLEAHRDGSEYPLLAELQSDPILLCTALYAAVSPTDVPETEFIERLGGEHFTAAAEAFWGALADFFQSCPGLAGRAAMIRRQTELLAEANLEMVEKMAGITLETAMRAAESGQSSIAAPGSSDLTPQT